ncbi:methylamine utilization protein MauF [Paracoccus sp. MC1854]|uniref:methylamine utilization protein MauF n=1 Tax=Paracoccus sp. MC1854 TaxID=2760306 RepID=UPI0016024544|nr:methylamine utilization protein MauF [Paracoccus sp. MC1854]MBB1491071.1 methylamine utilization protein MauF [Paracoccus sp. MC1854]
MASIDRFPENADGQEGVPDCQIFAEEFSRPARLTILAASGLAGAVGGVALAGAADSTAAVWGTLGVAAVAGGVLSTWSPCGYSSISLLRPTGRGAKAVAEWLPTFAMHGAGYALGALILGTALGALGAILGFAGFGTVALVLLALVGLIYGAHQLDFLRVPYPQRRAQVPHDARVRFSKPVVGGLYGLALGLDYMTYVQTPLLYLVTAAAVLTGNIPEAIALIALFNIGRFLPVAVTALPVNDYQIQGWLARNQERAAMADGAILVALGAALAVAALA